MIVQTTDPSPSRAEPPARGISLHRYLAQLVWWVTLPLMVLGGALAWHHVDDVQSRFEAGATSVAAAAATSIDRGLASYIQGLSMLADLPAAGEPERWPELYPAAQSFRRTFGAHVIVADPRMQIRLNTRWPIDAPGVPLLRPTGRAAAPLALATGKPAVGDAVANPYGAGERLAAIAVPIMRNGHAVGIVLTTLDAAQLQAHLRDATLPQNWSIILRDSTGAPIADSGVRAGAAVPATATGGSEPVAHEQALVGLKLAPWSVTVQIPSDEYQRPVRNAVLAMVLAGVLATAAGVVIGGLAGRRLEDALHSLAGGEGTHPDPRARSITEVAILRRRLDEAAEKRQRAEAELTLREHNYRMLFERNPNPMWVYDQDTLRFLAVNDAALDRYGYSREEFLAMTIADIRPPEEVPALRALLDARRAFPSQDSVFVGQFVHLTAKAERLIVEISVGRLVDFEGREATLVLARDVTARVHAQRERERAEALLHEREEQLRLFVEHAPVALAMFDREMRYLFVSRRWRVDYGLGNQALTGCSHYEIFPEIGEDLKAVHRRGLAGEIVRADEDRFVRVDGRIQWVRWEMRPWRDGAGAVGGVLLFTEDVTARMQALVALRDSERNFRVLAEQLPGIVYRARLEPSFLTEYVSPQVAELGFTPEEWIAHPERLWESIHPDDRERVRAAVAAARSAESDEVHLEYRMRNAQGLWRQCSDHARIVRPAEAPPFVLGVNIDVTRVRVAEAALQRSEYRYRTLADQLPAVIYIAPADASGPASYVSPAISTLGYTPQQWTSVAGPNWWQVLHPDDRERVTQALRASLAAGEAMRLEYRVRDSRGAWHHMVDYGRLIDDDEGRRLAQGVMLDVSDLKNTEHALMVSRSELSALAQRLLANERESTHHLAQTLHDHLGQSLAVARLHLDATSVAHGASMPPALKEECYRVARTLDQAIADVRLVLGELRPPMLENQGLIAALDNELRPRRTDRSGVDVLLEVDASTMALRWPTDVEYGAFMIAREAVVNALQHADATLVRVIVDGDSQALWLRVIDDGRGIADEMRQGRPGHLGLVGMRERALAIGAAFTVERLDGNGTCVALDWHEGTAS